MLGGRTLLHADNNLSSLATVKVMSRQTGLVQEPGSTFDPG